MYIKKTIRLHSMGCLSNQNQNKMEMQGIEPCASRMQSKCKA